jgi:hypothetical protein
MNRMVWQTAVALCAFSMFLHLAFAERLQVDWGEATLSDRAVMIPLTNAGTQGWERYAVTCRLFVGEKAVETISLTNRRDLKAKTTVTLVFPIKKPLSGETRYRVEAWIQHGSAKPVHRVWADKRPEVAKPARGLVSALGRIEEPGRMRHSIATIDVRKAMGLF